MTLLGVVTIVGCGIFDPGVPEGISVPEGFEVEIAAGPPLVERPMIVDLDDQGYLYVAESSGSNDDVQKQLAERPHSILRLEDVDGDGRFDRRTVFADGMMLPEGVLWHDGSVYVSAPPSIWKLTDTDGDGTADQREEWFDAKTLTSCANDLHGPYLGLDGWIYWTKGAFAEQTYERAGGEPFVTRAAHVFRRRPRGGLVEPVLTGGMNNPIEVAFTPEGERLLTSTFLTNPQLGRRDGILHAVYGGVYGREHGVTDGHPTTGGLLSVMTHMGAAAPVGLARLESGTFGEDYRGRLFTTSFNLRKVSSHRLVPKGASFETDDADFLVSESRDFHPTDVMEDADGSLLVVDTGAWYKLCCPTSQLTKPNVRGAIYRVRKSGAVSPPDPLGKTIDWNAIGPEGLVALLADGRLAVRRRAIAALADNRAVGALRDSLAKSDSVDVRRNAVWALTRIETEEARGAVRAALADASGSVRRAALHSIALHRDLEAVDTVIALLGDPSDAVKRVAAEALGRIGDPNAVGSLLAAAAMTEDEVLTHSLVYALIEIGDPESTKRGLRADAARTQRAAMIALDQMRPAALGPETVISRLQSSSDEISIAAQWIASGHPEWGSHLAAYLEGRLTGQIGGDSEELGSLLERFAVSPEIQALLARTVAGSSSVAARRAALVAMAAASLEEAPKGWAEAIASALRSDSTTEDALLAARRLNRPTAGAPVLDAALLAVADNEMMDPALRIRALDAALGSAEELKPERFELATRQVLPSVAVTARSAAARVLSQARLDTGQLATLAEFLARVGPMELPRLVEAFGQSGDAETGARFVGGLSKSPGLANLRPDIVEAVARQYPPAVRESLDSLLLGEVEVFAEQQARLDTMLAAIGPGDVVRGQAVFNSSEAACLSCHAIGHQGGNIGPGLTRIGEIRSRRDLLEAIVYPNASFVPSYEPVVVQTANESHSGVRLEENATHLVLAVNADDQVRVLRADIEEIRPGTVSVMPSGLEEQLSHDALADLLAFLEATRWGP